MITNYGQERAVGEVWIDTIDGAKVITVAGTGCKDCAFATSAGGACPGAIYDRHPCCAADRKDGREVYFKLIQGTTSEDGCLRICAIQPLMI